MENFKHNFGTVSKVLANSKSQRVYSAEKQDNHQCCENNQELLRRVENIERTMDQMCRLLEKLSN